ncbi:MAG: hypothetical protein KDD70_05285 [Bdellovibrionales bacterium]|nr:hypothetical protein [Bdellovibrionales bacterium]
MLFRLSALLLVFVAPPLLAQETDEPVKEEQATDDGSINYAEYYESLKKKYDELVKESSKTGNDAYEWVRADFKNMFSWEYKIVSTKTTDEEKLQKQLEGLGAERWELVQVVPSEGGYKFFFKRPPKSYLKSLPLKDMMRIFSFGGSGGGE